MSVTTIQSPDLSDEQIDITLPQLEKGGEVYYKETAKTNIKSKECEAVIQEFYKCIRDSLGEDAIVEDEIKVTIKSSNVMTMELKDIPGYDVTASAKRNETLDGIIKKNLRTDKKVVDVILCLSATCGDSGQGFVQKLRDMDFEVNGDNKVLSKERRLLVLVNKIDQVSFSFWDQLVKYPSC